MFLYNLSLHPLMLRAMCNASNSLTQMLVGHIARGVIAASAPGSRRLSRGDTRTRAARSESIAAPLAVAATATEAATETEAATQAEAATRATMADIARCVLARMRTSKAQQRASIAILREESEESVSGVRSARARLAAWLRRPHAPGMQVKDDVERRRVSGCVTV